MSEPSFERAFPLTGKEILLQSFSPLTPACNRHIHAPLNPACAPHLSPCCFSSNLPLNLLVMMQLVESGERRRERDLEGGKKRMEKRVQYA